MPTSASRSAPRSVAESPTYTVGPRRSPPRSLRRAPRLSSAVCISPEIAPSQSPSPPRLSRFASTPGSSGERAARMTSCAQLTDTTCVGTRSRCARRRNSLEPSLSSMFRAASVTSPSDTPLIIPDEKAASFMRRSKSESSASTSLRRSGSNPAVGPLLCSLSLRAFCSSEMSCSTSLSLCSHSRRRSPRRSSGAALSAALKAASMMIGVVSFVVSVSSKSVTKSPTPRGRASSNPGCAPKN
mmetsp:Transcript_30506/g.72640  ORF Transcript_30506/g.72640 Transcript_30506/m.72640 type:complete len:242 (-) Transcript_30506:1048-1773(-)